MSPKIVHLITTIERGGAEKQLLTLVREQVKAGFDIEILYLKGNPELKNKFESAGATVNPMLAEISFLRQISLLRKHLSCKGNFVHAHLPRAELLAALSCHKNAFIFSRHNAESFWPGAPRFLSILLSRFVAIRAARGIAISDAVKKFVLSNLEITHKYPFDVVHYGFDTHRDRNGRRVNHFSASISKSSTQLNIGTIGRLVPQKDYPTLIKAFALAAKIEQNLELFVIGEGFLDSQLNDLSADLMIEDKIHFLGKTEFIEEFLEVIDVFVLTSNYEGFGLVLLEAMSANLPILVANNSAIPEVVGSDYPGLFNTGDFTMLSKMMIDLRSQSERKKLANIVSSRLPIFAPDIMVYKISDIYNLAWGNKFF